MDQRLSRSWVFSAILYNKAAPCSVRYYYKIERKQKNCTVENAKNIIKQLTQKSMLSNPA